MNEVQSAEQIKKLTAPFLEKGYSFTYFYQKGGDSSCVYICRFQKGKDYSYLNTYSQGEGTYLILSASDNAKGVSPDISSIEKRNELYKENK